MTAYSFLCISQTHNNAFLIQNFMGKDVIFVQVSK